MNLVNSASVKPGDIILVFTPGARSKLNVAGQSVMRLRDIFRGEYTRSRYSHVMLGVSQGVVIHADGKTTKMEKFTDAIHGRQIDRKNLLVLRPANPLLSESESLRLVRAAQFFLQQKYSFIPGRATSVVGRLLHRRRPLTHPFCSELVAFAYAAIGRQIARRPADRVLPLDLEIHCKEPGWKDVTEEYITPDDPTGLGHIEIPVAGRVMPLPEFLIQTDRLLEQSWDHNVQQANLLYETAHSCIQPCVLVQQLRSAQFDISKALALNPQLLFTEHAELVRSDLGALEDFYLEITRGTLADTPPFSAALKALTPQVPPNERAYEVLPSFNTLRDFEMLGAALDFGARALRLETELTFLAIAFGIPIKPNSRFTDVDKDTAVNLSAFVFKFPATRMNALLERVKAMEVSGGGTYADDVRRFCTNVIRLHATLSILLHEAQERR